jgi:hypothetical protein
MTAVGGRVERLQEFHMPVDCERCQPVMRNPVGIAASTVDCVSTLDTDAPEGPRQKRSIIVDIAVSGPAIKAATDPSSSLRTQPAKPSRVASSRVHTRKLTPWTLPVIRTKAASQSSGMAASHQATTIKMEL